MRPIHTAPLAAAILLAACGGGADADKDAEGKIAGEGPVVAAGTIKPQPGQYRASYEFAGFDIPGAAEDVKQRAKSLMGGEQEVAQPITFCLTPEAAAKGPEDLIKNTAQGNCTFARFDVAGGTISADMQCTGPDGVTTHVVMDGQATTTGSTMTMTQDLVLPRVGTAQVKSRVTSVRIGDCPA